MRSKNIAILIAVAITLCTVNMGWSQQQWQYSQYMNNNFLLNPAEGGTETFTDIKVSVRTQWQGIEGSPTSGFISAHHPINKNTEKFDDVVPLAHHGIGGYISRDQIGPITQSSIYGSYSYHLPLTTTLTLSMGAFLGVKQFQLDKSSLNFEGNETDVVTESFATRHLPDATLGFWLYGQQYYLGGSMFQVFGNKINTEDLSNTTRESNLTRHLFLTSGYKFDLNEKLFLVPSLVVKYASPAPVQFDVNAKINYNDLLWGGFSYRNRDAVVLMAGITIDKKWDISYSYDINTSDLNEHNSGSHEILLGYRLHHSQGAPPAQFW